MPPTIALLTPPFPSCRLYLGMHSPIDLAAGMAIGVTMPLLLLCIDMHILHFWIHGPNVLLFHACLAVLQLFAYPTPPRPTPSYEDHNAFTGVILGLVSSYHLSLPGLGPHYLALPVPGASLSLSSAITIAARALIGLPLALLMKEIGSATAKQVLPLLCRALGIPVFSTRYVTGLRRVGSSMHRVGSAPGGIAGMRKAGSMCGLGGVEGRSGEVEGKRPAMGSCGGGSVFCEEFDEDEVVSVPWAVGGSSDVDAGAAAAAVAAGTAATAADAPSPGPVPVPAAAAAGERIAREKRGLRKRASKMRKSESAVSFAASVSAHTKSTAAAAAAKSPAKAQAWGTFAPAKSGEAAATGVAAAAAAASKARKAVVQQFDVDTGIRLSVAAAVAAAVTQLTRAAAPPHPWIAFVTQEGSTGGEAQGVIDGRPAHGRTVVLPDGWHTDGARQSGSRPPVGGRRTVIRTWSLALLTAAVASFDWAPVPTGSEARVAARAWDVGGLFGGVWEGDKDPINPFTLYGTVQCVGPHTSRDASAAHATVAWNVMFVAWCGAAWELHGMAWHCVAWRGMAWRGMAWRGVAWHGVAWHGMAWHGMA
ncbi:unnamed protein product [Closterium sp. NIES-54]